MIRVYELLITVKIKNHVEVSILYIPTDLTTGIDSPVISDSSHVEEPSITLPSTGTLSPGTTCK